MNYLAVGLGAAAGAIARYVLSTWAAAQWGSAFPGGTLLINLVGSALIGLLAGLFAGRLPAADPVRLLLITGLLGGFTTFSAFSLELYTLLAQGRYGAAVLYACASVGGGLLATAAGLVLGRAL